MGIVKNANFWYLEFTLPEEIVSLYNAIHFICFDLHHILGFGPSAADSNMECF